MRAVWPMDPAVETWPQGYQWMPQVADYLDRGINVTMLRDGTCWAIATKPEIITGRLSRSFRYLSYEMGRALS